MVLTNTELAKLVDTNDEWIASRTGALQSHCLASGMILTTCYRNQGAQDPLRRGDSNEPGGGGVAAGAVAQ
jgi:hypothetical protein